MTREGKRNEKEEKKWVYQSGGGMRDIRRGGRGEKIKNEMVNDPSYSRLIV